MDNDVPTIDGGTTPARARFPALDPEPPARSASRQAARAAAVVLVASAVAAGGFGLAHVTATASHEGPHTGQAVILTSAGRLALVTPGQPKAKVVPGFGTYGQIPPLPSGDGRYLVGGDGTVIAMSDRGLKVERTAVRLDTSTQHPPYTDALADHDEALVIISQTAGATATSVTRVAVAPLATGKAVDLGVADGAAGDPQAEGAFVSVPHPGAPPPTVNVSSGLPPDDRVELRDAGRPPVVLGTAASLNRALNQPAGQAVSLSPEPDAAGDKIAITVSPVSGPENEGIVIVDRTGHVLGTVPSTIGAGLGTGVSWSPDGSALTFAVSEPGSATAGVAVFSLSGQLTNRADPQTGTQPGGCFWAPQGATIVCELLEPGHETGWDEASADGGTVLPLPAPGAFLAWLPPPAAGSS